MTNPLVYLGLGMLVLVVIGYALNLKPRTGPTPLSEIALACGVAVILAIALGYEIALIPIGIAALTMLGERFRS